MSTASTSSAKARRPDGDKFRLRVDDRLRGRGARRRPPRRANPRSTTRSPACCAPRRFSPASAPARRSSKWPRPPACDVARVERFAHPVLLERSRAAELATAAHPVLADGPAVLTLLETVTAALVARGLNPDETHWDAWRNEDGRWTVQLAWKAGRSDNVAHFRFTPGRARRHGHRRRRRGQRADRPGLRAVRCGRWRRSPQLDFEEPARAGAAPVEQPEPAQPEPAPRARRGKPPCRRGRTCCSGCAPAAQR